jgi:hypothetical protein
MPADFSGQRRIWPTELQVSSIVTADFAADLQTICSSFSVNKKARANAEMISQNVSPARGLKLFKDGEVDIFIFFLAF